MLKKLLECIYSENKINPTTVYKCCNTGNLRRLKYLRSINTPIHHYASGVAIRSGHLNIVKYLVSINIPIDALAIELAESYGHLDILKYLLAIGTPYHRSTILIEKIKKEIVLEILEIVLEYIGLDISSIIFQNLL